MEMNVSQANKPETAKKVCLIDAALTDCDKTVNENYYIIKEINDYLFGNAHPEAKEGKVEEETPLGWFDKIHKYINDLRCRNTDIGLQLQKLHKEVISR